MQTCSINWNYSSYQTGDFLHKSSSCTNHSWHWIISFLIIASLLNVYFILHYHSFFCENLYLLEYLYFSEYDIWMSLYVFFWLRKGSSIKYATGNWWWIEGEGVIQNAYSCVQEEGVSHVICTYTNTLSHFMFLAAFVSYSVLYYL